MAEYYSLYHTPMDRSYYVPDEMGVEEPLPGLSPSAIGISAPPMQDQLQALKAKIFQGAARVELGFTGAGKGSLQRGATTPEMYGKDEREDIRQLAEMNKVKLSTHATVGLPPLSGMTERGFDEASRERAVHEIERAIDFAADTTHGGAVVVHTGEFPRAISEEYGPEFAAYPEESKRAVIHLVDKRTGEITPIRKDKPVVLPDYKYDENGEPVAQYDKESGTFKVKERTWDHFEKLKENWNKEHPDKKMTAGQMYINELLKSQEAQARGWSLYYSQDYENLIESQKKFETALEDYREIERVVPDDKKKLLKMQFKSQYPMIPADEMMPTEFIEKQLRDIEHRLRFIREGSASHMQQAETTRMQRESMIPIVDYAIDKTADTVARAGIFAMRKQEKMKKEGRLDQPLFVAPENIFPEQYGAHPDELKRIVLKSREAMSKKLAPAYGEKKAQEMAREHIKATFDVGHAYTWRKYFEGDPSKSIEENDRMFNNWLLKKVDELNKAGIIGHVHVSDNFGWEDEHVTPGEGHAPIKDFIEKMKKAGIKDVIVEPAHQDYRALLGGWRTFGSSVYGLNRGGSWSDIEYSYFGRGAPPYFLYGESVPRPDEWILWSGTRLE